MERMWVVWVVGVLGGWRYGRWHVMGAEGEMSMRWMRWGDGLWAQKGGSDAKKKPIIFIVSKPAILCDSQGFVSHSWSQLLSK